MATTEKAMMLALALKDHLSKRLTLAITSGQANDNNPTLSIGTGVAGTPNAFIKVKPATWPLAQDVLGNAARIYTPHLIQVVLEGNPTAGAGADVNGWDLLLPLLGEVLGKGTKVEMYNTANGTAPTEAGAITGNLKASWDDLYNPLTSSM